MTKINNWKDHIKSGYLYMIGESPMVACTGKDGAIRYGEGLEKLGFTSDMILESIQITNDRGIYNNTHFTPLSQIKWNNE